MVWTYSRLVLMLGVVVLGAGAGTTLAAEQPTFDLDVQLALAPEMTAQIRPGDTMQVILRPEKQFGIRSVPGEPIVLEKKYDPSMPTQDLRFRKALEPDQIYRLEMRIVRAADPAHPVQVRYLSALDKLPRRPVDKVITMRLFQGDRRDMRDNHVMVVRDQDNVYRVMLFTA